MQDTQVNPVRDPQHGDARIPGRRELEHVGEIEVERDQGPSLRAADLQQVLVCGGAQPLVQNRRNLVTCFPEEFDGASTEILVQLEIHAGRSSGISTKRFRLISAPYVMQARMSSRLS